MNEFTQKYVIAQFITPVSIGDEFASSQWPLHVTIAGVFMIDWDQNTVRVELRELLNSQNKFSVTVGENALFGTNEDIRVKLLKENDQLKQLHLYVVKFLNDHGAIFNNPEYQNDGFRPHITLQNDAQLHGVDRVLFNELAIVDMFPGQNPYQRKILQKLQFQCN